MEEVSQNVAVFSDENQKITSDEDEVYTHIALSDEILPSPIKEDVEVRYLASMLEVSILVETNGSQLKGNGAGFVIIDMEKRKCHVGGRKLRPNVFSNFAKLRAFVEALVICAEKKCLFVTESDYINASINLKRVNE
ncbi:Hypothetical protein SRAE_X000199800 [Strongyloides ratti]|uniref:RNase H type-1 domain-containing protein n=1 Tax=Strongyloides ratti TaxID=34506 RepID=A0A090KRZ4_STRRB|nr:Hypothetical protein SRAE_X000199800 [Strongyloides ratti]CEF60260.1 Hypothetical protein SRAE_X000199800 [Strongyloides ratti]